VKWPNSRNTDIEEEIRRAAADLRRRWVTPADIGRRWQAEWVVVRTSRPAAAWSQRYGLVTVAKRLTRREYRKGHLDRAELADVALKPKDHPRSRYAYAVRSHG
jgi:hypothetical protein